MYDTPQPGLEDTFIDICHPIFRRGYQSGLEWYSQDPDSRLFTDKQIVEMLSVLFLMKGFPVAQYIYFYVGQLFGHIFASYVSPRQSQEPLEKQQGRFLARVTRDYGGDLAATVQHLWELHDQLAQSLDADDFEQMLRHGAEKRAML